jgi:sugar lactone lactonase YvrE
MSELAGEPRPAVPRLRAELVVSANAGLGEGPVWDADGGVLWWVDIVGETVHRTDPRTGEDEILPVGRMIGAVALRASGGLVAAVRDGFVAIDPDTGRVELIAPVEAEDETTRMNDGKVDPTGRFWAGTMAVDHRDAAGTLYRLDPDLRVTPIISGTSISNGLDWSLDGRTMYYIDTPTQRVDRFAFDHESGAISGRTPAFSIPAEAGLPDGMTVDEEGYLWVALWEGWGVGRYSPEGRLDRWVDVPAEQSSSCTCGGPDLDQLFITTAKEGFPPGGKPDQPLAGGLFVCRPGVRGRLPFRFGG